MGPRSGCVFFVFSLLTLVLCSSRVITVERQYHFFETRAVQRFRSLKGLRHASGTAAKAALPVFIPTSATRWYADSVACERPRI